MYTVVEIDPAYREALAAAGLCDFDAFIRAPGGPAASRHAHRETVPIEIVVGGQPRRFFVKRVFKVPPKHAFWPVFRGEKNESQPAREWRVCRQLAAAGIPVMKPVAWGERRRWGMPAEAFLLVEAVRLRHTLAEWLLPGVPKPEAANDRRMRGLFYEVGVLVGELHHAGFFWRDICGRHIYAAQRTERSAGKRWDFCLIDVERMMRRPETESGLEGSGGVEPLTELIRRLLARLSPMRLERADFWRLVCGAGRGARIERGALRDQLFLDGLAARVDFAESNPRLPDNYEHPLYQSWERRGEMLVSPRVAGRLSAVGIEDLDAVLRFGDGRDLQKPGLPLHRRRTTLELPGDNGSAGTYYLKTYRQPPVREQIRRIWECGRKRSSGWREVHFAKRLGKLGIPTLRAVAYGQRLWGPIELQSYEMTEAIGGDSLETIVHRAVCDPAAAPCWAERREIIRQLALVARRMHRHGFFHRDLYLSHVLLTRNGDGGVVLHLIDLARMLANPRRRQRWALKDLAALDYSAPRPLVTRADRLRFLYDYDPELSRGHSRRRELLRELAEEIGRRTQRMARHDRRRRQRVEPGEVA